MLTAPHEMDATQSFNSEFSFCNSNPTMVKKKPLTDPLLTHSWKNLSIYLYIYPYIYIYIYIYIERERERKTVVSFLKKKSLFSIFI